MRCDSENEIYDVVEYQNVALVFSLPDMRKVKAASKFNVERFFYCIVI